MLNARTIAISIARPADEVFDFVMEPQNFLKWAFVGQSSMRHVGANDWEVETSVGRRILRMPVPNAHGILDHYSLRHRDDVPHLIAMRVVPNGDGTELLYTMFKRPGQSDLEWESMIEWITTDLLTLKSLLEYRSSELAAAS